MKKIILMGCLALALISSVKAQTTQVVNLTTGSTGIVGNNDPIWTAVTMPSGVTVAPIISNGSLCMMAGGGVGGNYANNVCGDWISPHTVTAAGATFGMIPSNTGQIGTYVYTMTFNSDPCPVASATINLNIAGADNTLVSISVNGNPYAIGVPFNPLNPVAPITVNPLNIIVGGLNTITVTVNNTSTYSALFMCGNLTINYGGTPVPVITSATSFCQGDALTFNGASSTGFIQNHFWEIAECDAAGTYTGSVWNSWYVGTPGSITFGHFIGFIPVCGKYYRIKLAVSSSCTDWVETTNIIFIECPPKVITETPEPICEGSSVTLTVSGDADDYEWLPDNIHSTSIIVSPSTTTTYTVVGTGANGCSISIPVVVTVLPSNLDIDLSTGVDNTNSALIPYGNNDDTWKVRGIPGTIYTSGYSSLTDATVIAPLTGSPYGVDWTSSPNENWITVPEASSDGKPIEVAATYDNLNQMITDYDQYYWLETEFNIASQYTNLRVDLDEWAVDNFFRLYLNSQATTGNPTNLIAGHLYMTTNQFSTLHYDGTLPASTSIITPGTNVLQFQIGNGGGPIWNGSYMGLLSNLHVRGECSDRGKSMTISDEEFQNERMIATTFIYPNPSAGNFTISCDGQTITSVTVKDAIGRVVKTINNINSSTTMVSLENENKGFYFAEIIYEGQAKPVYKKIILE